MGFPAPGQKISSVGFTGAARRTAQKCWVDLQVALGRHFLWDLRCEVEGCILVLRVQVRVAGPGLRTQSSLGVRAAVQESKAREGSARGSGKASGKESGKKI